MSRRQFSKAIAGLALAGGGLAFLDACTSPRGEPITAEPRLETTRLRLAQVPTICIAPQYVAEEFLHGEGFTDLQYLKKGRVEADQAVASGEIDIVIGFAGSYITQVDGGDPIVMLAGVHAGCFELFGTEQVRAIRDLKGKTVGVAELGSGRHIFLASVLAHVGLDPRNDVNFVTRPASEAMRLFAEGNIDAFMAVPPDPQELRAKGFGHVVVNSMMDRPWSQYFCCMVAANREFVRKHPVATKRVLRAILKANEVSAREPERVASFLVDKGYTPSYDYALQALRDVAYDRWREYDPEDTVRFYALRLQEAGMIKSNPQRIIAQGTDWRFLTELQKELPA